MQPSHATHTFDLGATGTAPWQRTIGWSTSLASRVDWRRVGSVLGMVIGWVAAAVAVVALRFGLSHQTVFDPEAAMVAALGAASVSALAFSLASALGARTSRRSR
jgi:Na+/phosphate symporter